MPEADGGELSNLPDLLVDAAALARAARLTAGVGDSVAVTLEQTLVAVIRTIEARTQGAGAETLAAMANGVRGVVVPLQMALDRSVEDRGPLVAAANAAVAGLLAGLMAGSSSQTDEVAGEGTSAGAHGDQERKDRVTRSVTRLKKAAKACNRDARRQSHLTLLLYAFAAGPVATAMVLSWHVVFRDKFLGLPPRRF